MNQKNEKGITLIALVITIIVLLILAGVTISMVLDDDGIIAQAQDAEQAQEKAELKEKIELWNGNVKAAEYSNEKITAEEYQKFKTEVEALADKSEIAEEDVKVSEGKITIDEKEVEISVPSNIITFTVCGCELVTEEGTTWAEFIGDDNEYRIEPGSEIMVYEGFSCDTMVLYIDGDGVYVEFYENGEWSLSGGVSDIQYGSSVMAVDEIESNTSYLFSP